MLVQKWADEKESAARQQTEKQNEGGKTPILAQEKKRNKHSQEAISNWWTVVGEK